MTIFSVEQCDGELRFDNYFAKHRIDLTKGKLYLFSYNTKYTLSFGILYLFVISSLIYIKFEISMNFLIFFIPVQNIDPNALKSLIG